MHWTLIILIAVVGGLLLIALAIKLIRFTGEILLELLFVFTQIEEDEFPNRPETSLDGHEL